LSNIQTASQLDFIHSIRLKIAAQSREMGILMIFMALARHIPISEKYLQGFASPEKMAVLSFLLNG